MLSLSLAFCRALFRTLWFHLCASGGLPLEHLFLRLLSTVNSWIFPVPTEFYALPSKSASLALGRNRESIMGSQIQVPLSSHGQTHEPTSVYAFSAPIHWPESDAIRAPNSHQRSTVKRRLLQND
ncbi:hypothetical protein B0H10DRAFT_547865 [Mycena sp. CBHHK59/15]|nr:hypothetical protein B0H10DRAFT_547865 [Mycena sp. CBHHK59/15]